MNKPELLQRLRNYADNPFRMGDNGFAYEDDTQLDALREGLVNTLQSDYCSFIPLGKTCRKRRFWN